MPGRVGPPHNRRRWGEPLNDEQQDFAAKLALIEREATLAVEDLPPSIVRDRVQHIAVVAQLLKARLEVASEVILKPQRPRKR